MPPAALLIEDDQLTSGDIVRALRELATVTCCASGHAALNYLASHAVDCVLMDYRLPDTEGLNLLRKLRCRYPALPVVVVTGAGSEDIAVEAIRLGAVNYIVKHSDFLGRLPAAVREALGRGALACREERPTRLRIARLAPDARERYRCAGILGDSAALEDVLMRADQVLGSVATVLIEGETGTGKELFARAIHDLGPRSRRPFVAVNCAAIPEPLLESELLGSVRGAFTGAHFDRQGLFEQANTGTLFLDEIAELSLAVQAKLLRVLQDRIIRPVGGSTDRKVNIRLIAATNRDLSIMVEGGLFRTDLYYRLAAYVIRLPTLSERREDVQTLAEHFLERLCHEEGKAAMAFHPETVRQLSRYPWPGNVRQLQHVIHDLVLSAKSGEIISPAHLPTWLVHGGPIPDNDPSRRLKDIVRDVECATIQSRLRAHGYQRTATARSLGMTREGLWAKMRTLGLSVPSCDEDPAT